MIIDLYGMPGSGKSTVCNYLEQNLEFKNVKNWYIEKTIGKIIFHLYLYLFFLDKTSRKKYKEIMKIIDNKKAYKNYINSNVNISLYIKYMLFDYYLERKNIKKIIIDEGIIHYSISLYVEFNLEKEKIMKIIELLKLNNVKYIGLKIDIEESKKNIKKRNRKRCPIDFLNDNELDKFLKKWIEGITLISDRYILLEQKDLINYIKEEQ